MFQNTEALLLHVWCLEPCIYRFAFLMVLLNKLFGKVPKATPTFTKVTKVMLTNVSLQLNFVTLSVPFNHHFVARCARASMFFIRRADLTQRGKAGIYLAQYSHEPVTFSNNVHI
jgi:hypothetical protein